MSAEIAVPYWALWLTVIVLVVLCFHDLWVGHRYTEALKKMRQMRADFENPKHFFWIGHHKGGEDFFRLNSIPRSRFHFVSERGGPNFHGYRPENMVFLFSWSSQAAAFDPVKDMIDMHYPHVERWYIP